MRKGAGHAFTTPGRYRMPHVLLPFGTRAVVTCPAGPVNGVLRNSTSDGGLLCYCECSHHLELPTYRYDCMSDMISIVTVPDSV